MTWTACYTAPGAEREVQSAIEKLDVGTCLPTRVTTWLCAGKSRSEEKPIIDRYVLIALPCTSAKAEWLQGIDGVQHMLPGNVTDKEVERLMWAHVTGAYNERRVRSANGRFASLSAGPRRTQKKRRRRPRHGKKLTHPNRGVGVLGKNHDTHRPQYAAGA